MWSHHHLSLTLDQRQHYSYLKCRLMRKWESCGRARTLSVSLSVNIPASYLCSGLPYLHFTVVGFIFCFLRSMLQCLVTLCKVMWPSQASAGTAGPETQWAANWVLNVAKRKHLHSVSRWDHFTCCIQTWLITVDHYHWSRHHFPSVPVFTFYHVHFTHSAVVMSWTL